MQFTLKSPNDWQEVIFTILPQLKHHILLLKGNLGAGKTTFTQYFVKELGSDDEVSSPTYTIVNEYNSPKGKIFHFDLYRMKNAAEVFDIGIEEYLEDGYFSILEWPEVFENEFWQEVHELSIEKVDDTRIVNFK